MGKESGLVKNFGEFWPKIGSCEKLLKIYPKTVREGTI